MPLVLDPTRIPVAVLEELRRSLREDLESMLWQARHPSGTVREPAGLEAAAELLESALTLLDLPGPRTVEALGAEVNLAYATMVAAVDLIKSHTDVPRVPRARPTE